jgi:hypothetical protein
LRRSRNPESEAQRDRTPDNRIKPAVSSLKDIAPEVLRDRHHLSAQQINSLLGNGTLKETYEEKVAQLELVREFITVTDALRDVGISFVPLKGPLLSFRLYGDVTFRHFIDLDILVDSTSVQSVIRIIEKDGYQVFTLKWPEKSEMQRRLLRLRHHISYIHPDKQIIIEIHWRLMSRQGLNFKRSDDLVKQNLSAINFAGRSFVVLNNELELLYLLIHGGFHHWGRLKWLADINQYLESQVIIWEKFNKLTQTLKAGRLMALCNFMLNEYFPAGSLLPYSPEAPPYIIRFSKKRIEGDYSYPDSIRTILQFLHFSLIVYPGYIYKIRLICNIIGNSIFFGRISSLFH